MRNVGLIIQGPLQSFGKSGRTAAQKLNLGDEGLVHYDCLSNIQRIGDEFGDLFCEIILSTWDTERRPEHAWRGISVTSLPDPSAIMDDSPRAYKAHNRNRQFIGIRQGLDWLRMHSKAEYVVQMRTDQFVDLRELLDSFERQVRHQRICVPFLRPGIFLASDFYIAADFSSFEDFVNAQLSHDRYEFIVDVHRDMILKYAYASFRGVLGVPDWAYFPRAPHAGMHKKTKDIFSYMLQEIFTPLSETTLRSVVWRGSPLSEEYLKEVRTEENASHEETRRSKMDAISVPALLSINWKRYYEFCRLYNKKKLSFWKEVLLIALGNVGWNGWVLLWKALKTGKRKVLWLAKRQSN